MNHVDPDAVVQAARSAWTRSAPIYVETKPRHDVVALPQIW
jgi:hypothetical protein